MKFKYLLFFPVIGIIYGVVLQLFNSPVPKPVILTIITVSGIVTLSSFFMRAPENSQDKAAGAQRFVIGTTIQILLSLAYLLYARFKLGTFFKEIAIHFILLFCIALILQSVLLLRSLRK